MRFLKKILLLDYEPKLTAAIRAALEKTGRYLVRVERDEHLVGHAPWFSPDLVVLEATDVSRQLRCAAALKNTPLLFVSGNATADKKIATAGVISGYSFLSNAVPVEDLIRCVDEMLAPAPVVETSQSVTR
jgi:DNA-binding response OmpR family regulator